MALWQATLVDPARLEWLLVGGSPEAPEPELVRWLGDSIDRRMAIDAGANALEAAGVAPTVLIGDGDSATGDALAWAAGRASEQLSFPSKKDDSDFHLALAFVRAHGGHGVAVSGVSGGRLDHQLAALGAMRKYAELGLCIVENDFVAWVVEGTLELPEAAAAMVASVVPLDAGCVVSEAGMEWELHRAPLAVLDDHGLSNVVGPSGATITCEGGACLVIVNAPSRVTS